MQKISNNLRKGVQGVLGTTIVIVLSVFVPMSAYADTTNPDTTTTQTPAPATTNTSADGSPTTATDSQTATSTAPAPATTTAPAPAPAAATAPTQPVQGSPSTGASDTGTSKPNGAAANTFTYNADTGLWENDYFTWNPKTHQTTPKSAQSYSYNPTTNKWDTTDWQYSPTAGKYVPNTYSVTQPPANAVVDPSSSKLAPQSPTQGSNSLYNTFFNGSISNNNSVQASTGNALISGNTYAGNASTGNATSMANLLNVLQSSTNLLSPGALTTFNTDIQGNVVGDLLINPGAIGTLQAAPSSSPFGNLTVNNQANGAITNNLAVTADTGNATIAGNTSAGNATTGNANAVANVINMLNSAVNAGQSFLGAVNIYGNLNGDILLPTGFLDSLLASNAAQPDTATTCSVSCGDANNNTTVTAANNSAINNNITSNAATGNATIAGNTSAGNAATGNATSNVTLLNLTGQEVVGKNDLLVFVNVLGHWYGMIMNAPTGATAASIGGGLASNSLAPTNGTTINSTNNSLINNNINVGATSGDATITNNTRAGDATTGNATTSVNLANFVDSHLALSDWFGILFINVFGTWNGSFGVDTAAGNAPTPDTGSTSNVEGAEAASAPRPAFGFIPHAMPSTTSANTSQVQAAQPVDETSTSQQQSNTSVLGASTNNSTPSGPVATTVAHTSPSWFMPVLGSVIAALLLGAEQVISRRQQKNAENAPVVNSSVSVTTV